VQTLPQPRHFQFEDVTAKVGSTNCLVVHQGAAVADYNCDGGRTFWSPLRRIALFRNESDGAGGRKFVDVTQQVGLKDDSWCTSAGWGDVDGDGFPDLYVCHYCDWSVVNNRCARAKNPVWSATYATRPVQTLTHALFKNDGGKAFGTSPRTTALRKRVWLGGAGGLNDDGRPDVYVPTIPPTTFCS